MHKFLLFKFVCLYVFGLNHEIVAKATAFEKKSKQKKDFFEISMLHFSGNNA